MAPGRRNSLLFLVAVLMSFCTLADETYSRPELRAELLQMMAADQGAREEGKWEKVQELDREHSEFLSDLLRESDWPRISEVGPDGAKAAWLLAQHADHNRDLQKAVLQALREYLPEGEANSQDVALLHDRIAVAEKRSQKYGTQGRCVEDKGWQPNEIEDPKQVDFLREEMGLPPFDSYSERMQQFCKWQSMKPNKPLKYAPAQPGLRWTRQRRAA